MTIWILCQYAGSLRHGMNYRPYFFGREFAAAGHRVVVVSGSYSHQFVELPSTSGRYTREAVDGLEYIWVRVPRYSGSNDRKRVLSWLSYAAAIPGLARLDLPKPDAIIVSSPVPYPIWPAARLSHRFAAVLAFDVRDIWPLSLTALGGYRRGHPVIRLTQAAEDFAYRRSALVTSSMPGALEHMAGRGLAPEKFEWISNGIDPDLLEKGDPLEPATEAALDGPGLRLCYAGSFNARNTAAVFVEAAAVLQRRRLPFTMWFVGRDTGGKDFLENLARERGCTNVRFLGPVRRSSMQALLARMDICLASTKESPLYRYGISLTKMFDYMLAGKPIVLSSGAAGELVTSAGCGIVSPPEDADAAAEAITVIGSLSPAERAAMGARGREVLLAEYTHTVLARRWLERLEGARRLRREAASRVPQARKGRTPTV
jgi:glycosyltransferase involved in cell wall biosynthesis